MKPMRRSVAPALLFLASACGDDSPADTDTSADAGTETATETATEPDGPFVSVVQGGIQGGVVLSGYAHGPGMTMVGGTLSSAPGAEPGSPGTIYWLQDGQLCRQRGASEHTLWWIEGTGDDAWFAVGERGTILRYDGTTLHDESVTTDAILYGARATEPAIAVGGDPFGTQEGEIWQREEDGTWTRIHEGLGGVAFKIHEDWIVGVGVAWQMMPDGSLEEHFPPNNARLLTVRKRGPDDVWAVGGSDSAVILHWDGSGWNEVPYSPACGNGSLNGVWTEPGGDIWVAGFFGAMARYDGAEWDCNTPPITFEHLHATWRHEGTQWWGGGALLSAGGETALLGRYGEDELALDVVDCEL